jgi:branched-chain amino acid transport system permease protein
MNEREIGHEPGPGHRRLAGTRRAAGRYGAARRLVVVAIPFNSNPSVNGNLTLVMSYAVASMGTRAAGRLRRADLPRTGRVLRHRRVRRAAMLAKTGLPYLLAVPLAAAVTFLIGLAFGIPAVRLRGLYLALVTLALAVAVGPVIKRAEPSPAASPACPCGSRRCRAGSRSTRTSGSTCSAWW